MCSVFASGDASVPVLKWDKKLGPQMPPTWRYIKTHQATREASSSLDDGLHRSPGLGSDTHRTSLPDHNFSTFNGISQCKPSDAPAKNDILNFAVLNMWMRGNLLPHP